MTADDVVYTFNRIINPKSPKDGLRQLTHAQVRAASARLTPARCSSTLDAPELGLRRGLRLTATPSCRSGFNPKAPDWLRSLQAAELHRRASRSSCAQHELLGRVPHVDKLTIIEFADPAARVNALLGGTVDAISDLPSAEIKAVGSAGHGARRPHRRLAAVHHAHRRQALQRCARAAGLSADRRPQGDDHAGLRRLRLDGQRHVLALRPRLSDTTCRSASKTSRRPSRCSRRLATTTT